MGTMSTTQDVPSPRGCRRSPETRRAVGGPCHGLPERAPRGAAGGLQAGRAPPATESWEVGFPSPRVSQSGQREGGDRRRLGAGGGHRCGLQTTYTLRLEPV